MSLRTPDLHAEAVAAYAAWCARQDDDDCAAWGELQAAEQDGWRRAVRLIHVLGLAEDGE